MRPREERDGFTLVELLVVVAIVGILVSLLLPAVQSARESARRIHCGNNLKQLAFGLHNYHDIYGQFPPGSVCSPGSVYLVGSQDSGGPKIDICGPSFRHASWGQTWTVALLPYIEQGPMWDIWDPSLPSADQPGVTGVALAVLKCPVDPFNNQPSIGRGVGATKTAKFPRQGLISRQNSVYDKGNYSGNYGGGNASQAVGENGFAGSIAAGPIHNWSGTSNRGIFSSRQQGGQPSRATLDSITDGSGNTILLAETLTAPGDDDCRGCWGLHQGTAFSAYTFGRPQDGTIWGVERIATPNVRAEMPDGTRHPWTHDSVPFCGKNASGVQLRCRDKTGAGSRGGMAARSYHPGGVQTSLCDGAVRFVSQHIDRITWRALITANGSENVVMPY